MVKRKQVVASEDEDEGAKTIPPRKADVGTSARPVALVDGTYEFEGTHPLRCDMCTQRGIPCVVPEQTSLDVLWAWLMDPSMTRPHKSSCGYCRKHKKSCVVRGTAQENDRQSGKESGGISTAAHCSHEADFFQRTEAHQEKMENILTL